MAGIYIHIPFCKNKCHYCNFYSVASIKYKDAYIDALLKEIVLQKNYLGKESVKTIYFGGGTPSTLSVSEIEKILNKLYKHFSIDKNLEITLEANPENINKEYISSLKEAGINRLSIGIQSFFDDDLSYLGRQHSAKDAIKAIEAACESEIKNISIDLIYGIPTLTEKKWEQNLNRIIHFSIPHISAYALTVEEKTALHNYIEKNKCASINEDLAIKHFQVLTSLLSKHDYIHYEISNFCKKNYYSQHNSNYWKGVSYLGLGPSAHSYNQHSRQWNISHLADYIKGIEQNKVPFEKEILSENQKFNEYILTSLRTIWGCDLQYIEAVFGKEHKTHCVRIAEKLVHDELLINEKNILFLTQKGKLFADGITSSFFIS